MNTGKAIGTGIFLFVLALAAGIFFLVDNLDALVKRGIESEGSRAAGTRVTVAGVQIDLDQARGTIRGLDVANPDGFSAQPLFALGEISLQLEPASITGNLPTLEEIRIIAPRLRFELNSRGESNLDRFNQGLASGSRGSTTETSAAGEKRLRIRTLTIADAGAEIDLSAIGQKSYSGTLPPIVLHEIGGSAGVTGEELAKIVFAAMTKALKKEATRRGIDALIEQKLNRGTGKLQRKLDEKFGTGGIDADRTLKKIFGN
ncbi:hypothetical protein JCM30471_09600 [Desulfuromonas carbonis]